VLASIERSPAAGSRGPAESGRGLIFVGEMYGVQLDQLAAALGLSLRSTVALVARWRAAGLADWDRLGPGQRWVWLTRSGLATCGLPYTVVTPALSRLAHLRAVTATRLALAAAPQFAEGDAFWRGERRIRARFGRRLGLREHVPDAEVHWPDTGIFGWSGECWAIEAELTPKTVTRTVLIMRETLTRTGDYGCQPADVTAPGEPPRHDRIIYLCSPAAQHVVTKARAALGELAARVEIRELPPGAYWPA
jgi:hypothetical protein